MHHLIPILKYCRKVWRIAVMCLMLCMIGSGAWAQERKYKVEAAYLYSFFNYITWPGYKTPQDLQHPVICIYGNDPILPYLNYVRDKMVSERMLTIRIVNDDKAVDGCNILFMRHRVLQTASLDPSILTVFKPDDPLDRDGLIELSDDMERIAIKINQPQLEQQGFMISSRLLDLAQRVK